MTGTHFNELQNLSFTIRQVRVFYIGYSTSYRLFKNYHSMFTDKHLFIGNVSTIQKNPNFFIVTVYLVKLCGNNSHKK